MAGVIGKHIQFSLKRLICVTFAVQDLTRHAKERKTETLNLRVTPELKKLIRAAAEKERRTIANFIEVLVRQHCEVEGFVAEVKRTESR
jgi:hypothetical protein